MKKTMIFIAITMLIAYNLKSATMPNLIPKPVSMQVTEGFFVIDNKVAIVISPSSDKALISIANQFIEQIGIAGGVKLKMYSDCPASGMPYIRFSIKTNSSENQESYKLVVTKNWIEVTAPNAVGCFYGLQTLLQLLPSYIYSKVPMTEQTWAVPCVIITDYPRFAYRGMHLDVGRHFFPVSFIKKYLDLMAMHKFNTFHWHLTEDQGWRIEIKKYPNLTKVGAFRKETSVRGSETEFDGKPYGGFYTQTKIQEVVAYATSKHITIIPEIEMPGHASAALASYPELGCRGRGYEVATKWGVFDDVYCAGKENTFVFIENVLAEVLTLFPGKYIHIGGDECPKASWKKCTLCQERMKKENIKDEHQLQSYFIGRIEKFLNKKGRSIIGWDEILEGGLAPNATVMSWQGVAGGIIAAKSNHNVIMSPDEPMYFNYYQYDRTSEPVSAGKIVPIDSVYSYDPVPSTVSEAEGKYILGGQGCVWTEFITTPESVEFKVFPRACALSEVLWSGKSGRNFTEFKSRLVPHLSRLDFLNVNYAKFALK